MTMAPIAPARLNCGVSAMTLDRLAELMGARFQQMDGRFDRLEHRTEAVENGLIELRIEMLERFHRVDTRIDRLGEEMRKRFRGIN